MQQYSCVSCFCGACDLRVQGHGGGHIQLIQLVLGSHSPLQHGEWGGGTGNIQPDPAALDSVEGEKQG